MNLQRWIKVRTLVSVTSYSQLLIELQKAKDKALESASKKAVDVVKDRVDKDVYQAGIPTIYERTYQLRDRLDVLKYENKGNISQAMIGHDISKMTSVSDLGQHASLVDGSSSLHSIAEIVHDGKSGHILGIGFWTNSRSYMANAQDELENGKYKQFMVERLKSMGYNVK